MTETVRLQDIADRAGVSRATVSLALRHHASIPVATRTRIQKLAEELGYRPNPLVSALMRHHRSTRAIRPTHLTLALVLKFSRRDAWQKYLSPDLMSGAGRRAEQLGYRLEEFWIDDLGLSDTRLGNVLFSRNVPGLIVAPLPAAVGQLRLAWEKFSAVAIGYSLACPQLHRVTTDRYEAMLLAVRELRRRGRRRIGLALDANQDARVHHQWVAAFLWEQTQSRPADRIPLLVAKDRQWTERRFAAWFQQNKPEAILGYDTRIVAWLKNLKRSIPHDTTFVHLWNPETNGGFAGLYHHPPEIGAAAVDYLVSLIQRNERGIPKSPHTLQLEASWTDGATAIASGVKNPPRFTEASQTPDSGR